MISVDGEFAKNPMLAPNAKINKPMKRILCLPYLSPIAPEISSRPANITV
jgi:hypothetical protein